jgi:hypothetical protein
MRFFVWLIQTIKSLFTREIMITVEKATVEVTTFTFNSDLKTPSAKEEVDPMECLENFTEVSLTV